MKAITCRSVDVGFFSLPHSVLAVQVSAAVTSSVFKITDLAQTQAWMFGDNYVFFDLATHLLPNDLYVYSFVKQGGIYTPLCRIVTVGVATSWFRMVFFVHFFTFVKEVYL